MILLTNGAPDDDKVFVAWDGPQMLFRAFGDGPATERLEELGFEEPLILLEAARQYGVVEIEDTEAADAISSDDIAYSEAA